MSRRIDHSLTGVWVPVITPFAHNGALDTGSLSRLVERLLNDGVAGIVALGTTGEAATLDRDERRRVVETCDAVCVSLDRPLMVGAGTNSTRRTIEEIEALTSGTNASSVLAVVPYYTRPSEQALIQHFRSVADASPLPIVAYNVPYRTGRGLGTEALLEIGSHPNVIGLKQAVAAIDSDTLSLLASTERDFALLIGDDAFIAPGVLMGASGAIAASAHICTPLFVDMVNAAIAGDATQARALANELLPVVRSGFDEPNPAVFKALLSKFGEITAPSLRRPLMEASSAALAQAAEAVSTIDDSR